MNFNLPVRAALNFCNQVNVNSLIKRGFLPIDGGAAKCKAIDSIFFDKLREMGYKGKQMTMAIEADWIISNTNQSEEFPNNDIVFSYINSNANGVVDFSLSKNFSLSGKKIYATAIASGVNYTIKVGKGASMNINYIFNNQEEFK